MNAKLFATKSVLICIALSSLALPSLGYGEASFDEMYFFGDSLSDSGNVYALTGQTSKAPYALIPSAPYTIGGFHFSNGKTWAERFAQNFQANNSGKAALDDPGKNGNYAFGGARARSNSASLSPSSATQLGMFVADHGMAEPDALYVIQFGGNDLRDALEIAAADPIGAGLIIQEAVTEHAAMVQMLYGYGGRQFLVANAPNLEHAPAVKLAGGSAAAGFFTGLYNGFLEGALQQLEAALVGVTIYRLNLAGFIDDVVANPGDFGITDTDSPCLNFFVESDAKCSNSEERLFWDGIHPTKAAHNELADVATAAVLGN